MWRYSCACQEGLQSPSMSDLTRLRLKCLTCYRDVVAIAVASHTFEDLFHHVVTFRQRWTAAPEQISDVSFGCLDAVTVQFVYSVMIALVVHSAVANICWYNLGMPSVIHWHIPEPSVHMTDFFEWLLCTYERTSFMPSEAVSSFGTGTLVEHQTPNEQHEHGREHGHKLRSRASSMLVRASNTSPYSARSLLQMWPRRHFICNSRRRSSL